MSELKIGNIAPAINSVDQNNNSITLEQFKGKKVVLYFYPKDMTPGCNIIKDLVVNLVNINTFNIYYWVIHFR